MARYPTNIWDCTACQGHPRVETNIRQQTEALQVPAKLLVVTIAPPFAAGVGYKKKASSVTNSTEDRIRQFFIETLNLQWEILSARGFAVLHAVKCAIIPSKDKFQNPPTKVVDVCVPRHFEREFLSLRPPVVIALGGVARRDVLKAAHCTSSSGLKLSGPLNERQKVSCIGFNFEFFTAKFPRGPGKRETQKILREAASLAGILS